MATVLLEMIASGKFSNKTHLMYSQLLVKGAERVKKEKKKHKI
jgi:hypothetical protein